MMFDDPASSVKPKFRIVGHVARPRLSVQDVLYLNQLGRLQQVRSREIG
jgi:hypothetical protein